MPDAESDRRAFLETAEHHTRAVGFSTSVGRFIFDLADKGADPSLLTTELAALDRAMAILRDHGRDAACRQGAYVDVGTQLGVSIVHALRTHRFGSVVAVEPISPRYLRCSLILNDVDDLVDFAPASALVDRAIGLVWVHQPSLWSTVEEAVLGDARPVVVAQHPGIRRLLAERYDAVVDLGIADQVVAF